MLIHLKISHVFCSAQSKRSGTLNPFTQLIRFCHFQSPRKTVALFWDLGTKPPKSVSPYEAAVKLKLAALSFGVVRHMIAYANRNAFSYVPQVVRERKERNRVVIRGELNACWVCGRRFHTNEKLVNHFKQVHEREHAKRLSQIESARGSRRVKLVGKYSMKMEKYKIAAREVLTPKAGRSLANEVQRAGYLVRSAVGAALRDHIVEMMDNKECECLMLVSDDSDFVDVVMEAKLRCLKTVVVGDFGDGALKRAADSGFSWNEVLIGKARARAVSVVGKWKDGDVLKRLEWTYKPDEEQSEQNWSDEVDGGSEDEETEGALGGVSDNLKNDIAGKWWELDSDDEAISSQSCR